MNLLVVDDHPLVAQIMAAVARAAFPEASVELAADLPQAIEAGRRFERHDERLDLVLLDLGLPGCEGLSALGGFLEALPGARVVVVSATEEREVVLAALEAGACGYIPKTSRPDVISAALKLVAAGGTYVPPQALGPGAERSAHTRSALTDRQLDVLRLIAKGLANKEIAKHLRIANETVKQHARAVYAALGVGTRAQAARAAEQRGIKLD